MNRYKPSRKSPKERLEENIMSVQQQVEWVQKNPELPEKERVLADLEERRLMLLSRINEFAF